MTRRAAFALGAALMLDGVAAAQATDLYLPDATSVLAGAPSFPGVLPSIPENWSDLPVKFMLSERAGYDSNILNTPVTTTGATTAFGRPIGSLESISNYGASTKVRWEGQEFFASGSIGMYRYLSDTSLNSLTNSLNLGDNWTYGSKCSGKLELSEQTSPSEPGLQVGFNVFNKATAIAFNETSNCLASGNYALQLNSGASSTTNSAAVDKLNDSHTVFVAAGITYSVSQTNSLQLLATVTGTTYSDRPASLQATGLASNIVENELNLTYTKNFSPNFALTASAGVVGSRPGSFSLEPVSGFLPIYSATVAWTAAPRLKLTASASRTVSPPTSVVANLQVTESAELGLSYDLTPKVLLAGGVHASRASGSVSGLPNTSVLNSAFGVFAQNSSSYSANASVNYTMTPFLTANLSYTFTKTVQANFETPTTVVLLALSFNPY